MVESGAERALELLCSTRQWPQFECVPLPGGSVIWIRALRRRSQRSPNDQCAVWSTEGQLLPTGTYPASMAPSSALTPKPKTGARCASSARWDLREGRRATGIPIAPPAFGGITNLGSCLWNLKLHFTLFIIRRLAPLILMMQFSYGD